MSTATIKFPATETRKKDNAAKCEQKACPECGTICPSRATSCHNCASFFLPMPKPKETYTREEASNLARLVGYLSQLPLDKWQWWEAQATGHPMHRYADQYERARAGRVRLIEDKISRMTPAQLEAGWAALQRIDNEPWQVEREIKTAKLG